MSDLGTIWAQDVTGILGVDGGILWRAPANFVYFKVATMGCGLVMGRTTWDLLGGPLPGRRNTTLTRNRSWRTEGMVRAGSLCKGLSLVVQSLTAELGYDPREGDAARLPRL